MSSQVIPSCSPMAACSAVRHIANAPWRLQNSQGLLSSSVVATHVSLDGSCKYASKQDGSYGSSLTVSPSSIRFAVKLSHVIPSCSPIAACSLVKHTSNAPCNEQNSHGAPSSSTAEVQPSFEESCKNANKQEVSYGSSFASIMFMFSSLLQEIPNCSPISACSAVKHILI